MTAHEWWSKPMPPPTLERAVVWFVAVFVALVLSARALSGTWGWGHALSVSSFWTLIYVVCARTRRAPVSLP